MDFIAIDKRAIDLDATHDFDLYRRQGGNHVLFLAAEAELSEGMRTRLDAASEQHLYISADDRDAYTSYALARMIGAVQSPDLPPDKKAEIGYQGSRYFLDQAFKDPRTESISDVKQSVDAVVDMALHDPEAMSALMRLTRHDTYTYNHSMNVAVFGMALAMASGEDAEWQRRVAAGLFLHDIGKTRIPVEVINWPGKLSRAQWASMRRHPEFGVEVLQESGELDELVLSVAHQHHERDAGKGYPQGLKGDEICREAKICAVADVFDALTTHRPYKPTFDTFKGLQIMIDEMQADFDTVLFKAFIGLFSADDIERHAVSPSRCGEVDGDHRPRGAGS